VSGNYWKVQNLVRVCTLSNLHVTSLEKLLHLVVHLTLLESMSW
jgi:hypothetical protein